MQIEGSILIFFETIDEYTKAKIKKNYLIPYARYLEGMLRDLLPKIQAIDAERIRLVLNKYTHSTFFLRFYSISLV